MTSMTLEWNVKEVNARTLRCTVSSFWAPYDRTTLIGFPKNIEAAYNCKYLFHCTVPYISIISLPVVFLNLIRYKKAKIWNLKYANVFLGLNFICMWCLSVYFCKFVNTCQYWITNLKLHGVFLNLIYVSGMHFNQAVAIIQSQIGIIKGVQVIYSDTVSINRIFVIKQWGCSFN